MGSIYGLLTSPEWWFSAVIIAVPVGILSGYFKDWLSSGLASVSAKYMAYRDRKRAARERVVAFLAQEPDLLTIEFVRLTQMTVGFVGMMMLALFFPAVLTVAKHFPDAAPFSALPFGKPMVLSAQVHSLFIAGFNAALFLAMLFTQYRLAGQMDICRMAKTRATARAVRLRAAVPA